MVHAKWVIGSVLGAHTAWWFFVTKPNIEAHVFGWDGNGGSMLKIITDLTDEEMARLKHARRMNWHWRGNRQLQYGKEKISDQELSDRGIIIEQEPYVEYIKRPPHDKYL
jgi:hypothetical protein